MFLKLSNESSSPCGFFSAFCFRSKCPTSGNVSPHLRCTLIEIGNAEVRSNFQYAGQNTLKYHPQNLNFLLKDRANIRGS